MQADAFLYHVVLQVSAFELEWRRGIPNTFHSEAYARECIRLLKDRVENSVSGISDQTIAAVATLASIEVVVNRSYKYLSLLISCLHNVVFQREYDGYEDSYSGPEADGQAERRAAKG